jgi:hypothetical protein
MDSGWKLIEQDPVLRQELGSIEHDAVCDDDMVCTLLEFYSRIERMMKLTAAIIEEDGLRLRQEDFKMINV